MGTSARDEFDEAARYRQVVGAHRPRRGLLRRILPALLVLILAPLCAWLVFHLGLRGQVPQAAEAVQSLRTGDAASASGPSASATSTPPAVTGTDGPPDPTAIDRRTAITLFDGTENGTGETVAAALADSGYTAVTTLRYTAAEPAGSTVYMRSGQVSDTAADVARIVSAAHGTPESPARISVVESASAATSAPVVVVLR